MTRLNEEMVAMKISDPENPNVALLLRAQQADYWEKRAVDLRRSFWFMALCAAVFFAAFTAAVLSK